MINQNAQEIDLGQLVGLTEDQRLAARQAARQNAIKRIGPRPDRQHYEGRTAARWPGYVVASVTAITLVLILAFFLISAMRLFTIGSQTFGQRIDQDLPKLIAGLAIVVGSETGALGFMLAAGVLADGGREKRTFYALALASTLIALIGNGQFALGTGWQNMILSNPFAVLEAIFPPVVVLGGALVIERLWLADIGRRHANEQLFQADLADWLRLADNPDDHPDFKTVYMHALKAELIRANGSGRGQAQRREIMAAMSGYHWRQLVDAELNADQWATAELTSAAPMVQTLPGVESERHPLSDAPELVSSTNGNGRNGHS